MNSSYVIDLQQQQLMCLIVGIGLCMCDVWQLMLLDTWHSLEHNVVCGSENTLTKHCDSINRSSVWRDKSIFCIICDGFVTWDV